MNAWPFHILALAFLAIAFLTPVLGAWLMPTPERVKTYVLVLAAGFVLLVAWFKAVMWAPENDTQGGMVGLFVLAVAVIIAMTSAGLGVLGRVLALWVRRRSWSNPLVVLLVQLAPAGVTVGALWLCFGARGG